MGTKPPSRRAWSRWLRWMDTVAGLPPRSSFYWGDKPSLLAMLAFYGFAILRTFSLLQLIKTRVRSSRTRTSTNQRKDFPSLYTELYFFAILGISIVAWYAATHFNRWQHSLPDVLLVVCWYFIVETTCWILYVLLIRDFIERQFTIYHPAEYILQLPVVLTIQCLLLAVVVHASVASVVSAIIGSGGAIQGGWNAGLGTMGQVYLGVLVAALVGSLPILKSRESELLAIIGAGSVVIERMLPALEDMEYRRSSEVTVINVIEDGGLSSKQELRFGRLLQLQTTGSVLAWLQREQEPVIIATPTSTHMDYLEAVARIGVPFAVEKPICNARTDRQKLVEHPSLMERGFALSYYCLEKALALNFVFNPHSAYRAFLSSGTQSELPTTRDLSLTVSRLGKLTDISISLIEDSSKSPSGSNRLWTEQPPVIDSFIETTVHPLAIVSTILSEDEVDLHIKNVDLGVYGPRQSEVREIGLPGIAPTFFSMTGEIGGANVGIVVAKHAGHDWTERMAVLHFAEGSIHCDFDTSVTTVRDKSGKALLSVQLKDQYRSSKYRVQLELFREMSLRGWGLDRYDGLEDQLNALRWWDQICDACKDDTVLEYDDRFWYSGGALQLRPAESGAAPHPG